MNDTGLRYVQNSGVCETTPGVNQVSGYVDVGQNQSMWFWFFEARENPENAPFTIWVQGGPGCSSMIGLFQENGPCTVNADNETVYNPYSWNNASNIIYVDQPIGTGFSYGTDTANSTVAAAPPVWTLFQMLFETGLFSNYSSREIILGTESYGGHYGPEFVTYFNQQNSLIESGDIQGVPIKITAMLINNGFYDPYLQNNAALNFSTYAPGYGQLVSDEVLANISNALYMPGGCNDLELQCYAAGNLETSASDDICYQALVYCADYVVTAAIGDHDEYDLRQGPNQTFPPEYYVNYLQETSVAQKIGAEVPYAECDAVPYYAMWNTGDNAKTLLPQLSELVNSGLRVLLWHGDADIVCNWLGGLSVAQNLIWYGNETFNATPMTNITVNGKTVAAVQNAYNFTFARVYGSGHEVAAFIPEGALEIFRQVIAYEPLHSA